MFALSRLVFRRDLAVRCLLLFEKFLIWYVVNILSLRGSNPWLCSCNATEPR